MSRVVQLVADYGPDDLACAELIQRLALAVPDSVVQLTRVAHGDTLAAGFCVARLALTDGPPGRIVAHDVRPATGTRDPRMCTGRAPGEAWIVGPVTAAERFAGPPSGTPVGLSAAGANPVRTEAR